MIEAGDGWDDTFRKECDPVIEDCTNCPSDCCPDTIHECEQDSDCCGQEQSGLR